jgi:hypothetical protein
MLKFVEDKWGDIVGLFMIIAGATLVACVPSAKSLGQDAFCAGLLALKLHTPTSPNTPSENTRAVGPTIIAGASARPDAPAPPITDSQNAKSEESAGL